MSYYYGRFPYTGMTGGATKTIASDNGCMDLPRTRVYTDGLVESRNHHGGFLPEDQIATALLAADCDQALDTLLTAVHRHIGGHGHDDMALLLLEYGCSQGEPRNPP